MCAERVSSKAHVDLCEHDSQPARKIESRGVVKQRFRPQDCQSLDWDWDFNDKSVQQLVIVLFVCLQGLADRVARGEVEVAVFLQSMEAH